MADAFDCGPLLSGDVRERRLRRLKVSADLVLGMLKLPGPDERPRKPWSATVRYRSGKIPTDAEVVGIRCCDTHTFELLIESTHFGIVRHGDTVPEITPVIEQFDKSPTDEPEPPVNREDFPNADPMWERMGL